MRSASILLVLFFTNLALAQPASKPSTRKIELVEDFNPPIKAGPADLIVPLPLKGMNYQRVLSETHVSNASWVHEQNIDIDHGKYHVRVVHAHWNNVATVKSSPHLRLREVLLLTDRNSGMAAAHADSFFLQPSEHVQTDGIVRTTAMKVTKGLTDPDAKARAIYDWIVKNTFRDPKVRGCGTGDAKSTLTVGNFGGKCADLNSLFVAMARASGVPAREVFGLRVAPSKVSPSLGKDGDVSKAQHCRAEYYSWAKKAWFPADAADVRKVILEEHLKLTDPHVQQVDSRLFGRWEGNWVALNFGRDLQLPNGRKINFLMYPQLVAGSFTPDGVDPEQTGYKFTSKVLSISK